MEDHMRYALPLALVSLAIGSASAVAQSQFSGFYGAAGGAYGVGSPRDYWMQSAYFSSGGTVLPQGVSGLAILGFNGVWGSFLAGIEFSGRLGQENVTKSQFQDRGFLGALQNTASTTQTFRYSSDVGAHLSARAGIIFNDTLLFGKIGVGFSRARQSYSDAGSGIFCPGSIFGGCQSIVPGGTASSSALLPSFLIGIGAEQNFGSWFLRGGVDAEAISGPYKLNVREPDAISGSTQFPAQTDWTVRGNLMLGVRF